LLPTFVTSNTVKALLCPRGVTNLRPHEQRGSIGEGGLIDMGGGLISNLKTFNLSIIFTQNSNTVNLILINKDQLNAIYFFLAFTKIHQLGMKRVA